MKRSFGGRRRRCIQAVDAEKKVMIGLRLGDLWTDTSTYSKETRAGEQC